MFATFAFSDVIYEYKAKISSRNGGISPVRQGPCGLTPALPVSSCRSSRYTNVSTKSKPKSFDYNFKSC